MSGNPSLHLHKKDIKYVWGQGKFQNMQNFATREFILQLAILFCNSRFYFLKVSTRNSQLAILFYNSQFYFLKVATRNSQLAI